MNIKRTIAIARKEILQILRDTRSLILAFLLPITLIFLFGYAITLDIKKIPTVIIDYSNSTHSRELIRKFTNSGYFVEMERPINEAQLQEIIDHSKARVGIIIPADFAEKLQSSTATIMTVTDGADANTAQSTIAYTSMIISEFNLRHVQEVLGERFAALPIQANVRFWYNPDLNSQNFLIPGLISLIMTILGSLLASLTIAREWERGTMELLISTPVTPLELAIGKLLPYYVIGMVDLFLATYVSIVVFAVPFRGSLLLLTLFSSLFLAAALSIGYLISVVTKSQQLAYQFSMLTSFLPGLLLSGFLFPLSSMPPVIKAISFIAPGRYFIVALRGLFLKGSDFLSLLPQALALMAFAVVFGLLAFLVFRKKIQ
jgi:ABC-2 type transport system permease protein